MPPPTSPVSHTRNRRSHVGTSQSTQNQDRSTMPASLSNGGGISNASWIADSSSTATISKPSRLGAWKSNFSNGDGSSEPADNLQISDADMSDVDSKKRTSLKPRSNRRKSTITPSSIIPGAVKKSQTESSPSNMPPPASPVSRAKNRRSHVGTPQSTQNQVDSSISKPSRLGAWISNLSNVDGSSTAINPSEPIDNLQISDADFSDVDDSKKRTPLKHRSSRRAHNMNGDSIRANVVTQVTAGQDHVKDGGSPDLQQHYKVPWTHYIPNVLIFTLLLLFLIGVGLYFFRSNTHVANLREIELKRLECHPKDVTSKRQESNVCFNKEMLRKATNYTFYLFEVLSEHAAQYYCLVPGYTTPKMQLSVAKASLDATVGFGKVSPPEWKVVLYLILHMGHKHWSLAVYNDLNDRLPSDSDPNKIKYVECLRPRLPTKCRVFYWLYSVYDGARQFAYWCIDWLAFLTSFILMVGLVLVLAGIIIKIRSIMKQRALRHQELISDAVIEIIKVLKDKHDRNSEVNGGHVPVNTVRSLVGEVFVQVQNDKFWAEVCDYVNNNERSIGVETKRGTGEVWYWKGGSGWQGSALPNRENKLSIHPPRECLKVRNMLPNGPLSTDTKRRVFREILRYCNDVGDILHIGAKQTDDQGLIYIRCASREVAGETYKRINANYFDGKLVFVKFISLDKYFSHFPEARAMVTPLNEQIFV